MIATPSQEESVFSFFFVRFCWSIWSWKMLRKTKTHTKSPAILILIPFLGRFHWDYFTLLPFIGVSKRLGSVGYNPNIPLGRGSCSKCSSTPKKYLRIPFAHTRKLTVTNISWLVLNPHLIAHLLVI